MYVHIYKYGRNCSNDFKQVIVPLSYTVQCTYSTSLVLGPRCFSLFLRQYLELPLGTWRATNVISNIVANDVCRSCKIITFVAYDVYHLIGFVAYEVWRIMTFYQLWRLSLRGFVAVPKTLPGPPYVYIEIHTGKNGLAKFFVFAKICVDFADTVYA